MRQVRVDVLGTTPVARMLDTPAENSRDFRKSWELIFGEFERITQDQFASRGSALGTPWPAKADGTPATLHDTGALEGSFKQGGTGHVREAHADSAEWGSDLEVDGGYVLGELHQVGAGNLPQRVIFDLGEPQRRKVVDILMAGLFRDSGGRVRASSGRFSALGF